MKTRILQILGVAAIATIGMVSCDTDLCKDVDCGIYGDCVEGDCVCDDGYSGVACATAWVDAFAGVYDGVDTCGFQYESTVAGMGTALTISNAFGLAGTGDATILTTSTIQIPSQDINGYTVSGSGSLVGSALTINYTIDGDACQVVYTK